MKKITSFLLVLSIILSLSLFSGCGKKYDGEIIVYNWGGPYMAEGSNGTVDLNKAFEGTIIS